MNNALTTTYARMGMFRFVKGNEICVVSEQSFGQAYVFTQSPGDVVKTMTLSLRIVIA
jgi:hypothetical protein